MHPKGKGGRHSRKGYAVAIVLAVTLVAMLHLVSDRSPIILLQQEETPNTEPLSKEPIRLVMGGDLLLSAKKEEHTPLENQLSPCEKLADPKLAWTDPLVSVFANGDAVFANLETPVSDQPFQAFRHPNGFVKGTQAKGVGFQAISQSLDILKAAHISAVSLSNNHILDTPTGVADTVEALTQKQIPFAGAGLTLQKAMEFVTIPARHHPNTKIAFLSASDMRSIRDAKTGFDETADFVKAFMATEAKPGVWDLATSARTESLALDFNANDFVAVEKQIRQARQDHDLVVLYLHFQPNVAGFRALDAYKSLARKVVDAGADIFVGQHPHHMQEFEFYRGRPMIMGAGEMLRSYVDQSFAKMDYLHEILYHIHWPLTGQEQRVTMDLILIETKPLTCSVEIETNALASARERVRRMNPGKVFQDIDHGLRYVSEEPLLE